MLRKYNLIATFLVALVLLMGSPALQVWAQEGTGSGSSAPSESGGGNISSEKPEEKEKGKVYDFPWPPYGDGACERNMQNLMTVKGDSWTFAPGGEDDFNSHFGEFEPSDGYVSALGVQAGCLCEMASMMNYVWQSEGLKAWASQPLHASVVGVPPGYEVSIWDNGGEVLDANGRESNATRGRTLFLQNNSNKIVSLRWRFDDQGIHLWVERGKGGALKAYELDQTIEGLYSSEDGGNGFESVELSEKELTGWEAKVANWLVKYYLAMKPVRQALDLLDKAGVIDKDSLVKWGAYVIGGLVAVLFMVVYGFIRVKTLETWIAMGRFHPVRHHRHQGLYFLAVIILLVAMAFGHDEPGVILGLKVVGGLWLFFFVSRRFYFGMWRHFGFPKIPEWSRQMVLVPALSLLLAYLLGYGLGTFWQLGLTDLGARAEEPAAATAVEEEEMEGVPSVIPVEREKNKKDKDDLTDSSNPPPSGDGWTKVRVKVSHYNPALGGPNCGQFVRGQCMSNMASGRDWRPYFDEALACPSVFPFGTEFYVFGKTWICLDRGGAIVKTANGSFWIDLLTKVAPVPYGTEMDAWVRPPTPKK